MERQQSIFVPVSLFGYRHRVLLALGLATFCLLAVRASAFTAQHGPLFPLESSVERESVAERGGQAVLAAGETVTLGTSGTRVERLPAEDLRDRLAWTAGLIHLDGQTLTQAVAEFNRYNRRKLSIADPTIATLQVRGTFKATEPDSFVAWLARSAGVHTLAREPRLADTEVIRLVGTRTSR